MASKAIDPRKGTEVGRPAASTPEKMPTDKRINDVFEAIIDGLLDSLEHNYNRRKPSEQ